MLVLSKTSEAWWQLLSEGSSHYSNGNIKAEGADERGERPQITLFTGNNSNPFINQHGPRVTKSVTIITLYCADNRKQQKTWGLSEFPRWKYVNFLVAAERGRRTLRQSGEILQLYTCHLSYSIALFWQCRVSGNIPVRFLVVLQYMHCTVLYMSKEIACLIAVFVFLNEPELVTRLGCNWWLRVPW